jgi:hypothetical protein
MPTAIATDLPAAALSTYRAYLFHRLNPDGSCGCGRPACPSPGKHPSRTWDGHPVPLPLRTALEVADRTGDRVSLLIEGDILCIDLDVGHRPGQDGIAAARELGLPLPPTAPTCTTPRGGLHLFFRCPPALAEEAHRAARQKTALPGGIDVFFPTQLDQRTPCSALIPPSGGYTWRVPLTAPEHLPMLPDPWIAAAQEALARQRRELAATAATWAPSGDSLGPETHEGARHNTCVAIAGRWLNHVGPYACLQRLATWNTTRCRPPLPAQEVHDILNSLLRSREAEAPALFHADPATPQEAAAALRTLPATTRRWVLDHLDHPKRGVRLVAIENMLDVFDVPVLLALLAWAEGKYHADRAILEYNPHDDAEWLAAFWLGYLVRAFRSAD